VIDLDGDIPLRPRVLVAAFEGWNDAADAASGAVDHLATAWGATEIGVLDPDEFYDFQVNRPSVSLSEGLTRKIEWPTSRLLLAAPPDSSRDVVLLRGLEPNMRWRAFCSELLGAVHELGVELVVTLGALLADAPHTRPVQVTGSAHDEATATRLRLDRSKYEGPTGIVGVFQDAAERSGLPAVSFWAAVPHYVAQPPCPKATLALLGRVEELLDVAIPMGGLPEEARAWETRVDELAREDSEVMEYVRALESREPAAEHPEASGDAIAREFERYLRRRGIGEA
jgi:proteasome assembly chaperone (PAC2) family protein